MFNVQPGNEEGMGNGGFLAFGLKKRNKKKTVRGAGKVAQMALETFIRGTNMKVHRAQFPITNK